MYQFIALGLVSAFFFAYGFNNCLKEKYPISKDDFYTSLEKDRTRYNISMYRFDPLLKKGKKYNDVVFYDEFFDNYYDVTEELKKLC
jgi:hypothetical protein